MNLFKLFVLQDKVMDSIKRFIKREDGASAIEYAIIAGLIAVGIIVAAKAVGTDIVSVFDKVSKSLKEAAETKS